MGLNILGIIVITVLNSLFVALLASKSYDTMDKVKGWMIWFVLVFVWLAAFLQGVFGPEQTLKSLPGWIMVFVIFGPFVFGNILASMIDKGK